jgi:hypothetical protein
MVEFGPVMFNAYRGSTAALRSCTDEFAGGPRGLEQEDTTPTDDGEAVESEDVALTTERAEAPPHSPAGSRDRRPLYGNRESEVREAWRL